VGLPHSKGPRGSGNLKFTIYALLVPKTHHIKFEKNWSKGYQGVKNVHMLTDTIYQVWPCPGGKTSTLRIMKFTILVKAFLVLSPFIYFFLHTCSFKEEDFLKTGQILHFLPYPIGPRGKEN
jgi:hypothetical protein